MGQLETHTYTLLLLEVTHELATTHMAQPLQHTWILPGQNLFGTLKGPNFISVPTWHSHISSALLATQIPKPVLDP